MDLVGLLVLTVVINVIHHGGNIDGFSALVSFMPNENIGLIVLTNSGGKLTPYLSCKSYL